MPVNTLTYCLFDSSVTHDIAKIDNYSVYRRLGNKTFILQLTHMIGGLQANSAL